MTYRVYNCTLNRIGKHFDSVLIADIKQIDIQRYITSLNGYSSSLIKKNKYMLKSLFESAASNGIISESPFKNIKAPSGTTKGHRALKQEERKIVCDNANYNTASLIAHILLHTGMRREEVVALKDTDIDIENNVIHIIKALNLNIGKLKSTKTTAGNRDIPILMPIRESLIVIKNRGAGFLFDKYGDRSKPITITMFEKEWKSYIEHIGCYFTPHDLRYTEQSGLNKGLLL